MPYEVVDDKQPKRFSFGGIILVVAVLVVAGAIALGGSAYMDHRDAAAREQQALAAYDQYQSDMAVVSDFGAIWDAEVELASRTARIALSPRVAELQRLRREWDSVAIGSACVAAAKPKFATAMDSTIQGFLAFMSKSESESQGLLRSGLQSNAAFLDDVIACKPPAPR